MADIVSSVLEQKLRIERVMWRCPTSQCWRLRRSQRGEIQTIPHHARRYPVDCRAARDAADKARGVASKSLPTHSTKRPAKLKLPTLPPPNAVNYLDLIQWPAMVITIAASWFVASRSKRRRSIGFWVFLLSNLAWVAWGIQAHAYGLITLQVCLAAMNIRGVLKAEDESAPET